MSEMNSRRELQEKVQKRFYLSVYIKQRWDIF